MVRSRRLRSIVIALVSGLLLYALMRDATGMAEFWLRSAVASHSPGIEIARFLCAGFSLLAAITVWIVLFSELRLGSDRLTCCGWLATAVGFTALAVLMTPALHFLVPTGLFDGLQRFGWNSDKLSYPMVAQFGFVVLLFLFSQKAKGLNVSRIAVGFTLLLISGLLHLFRQAPVELDSFQVASVSAAEPVVTMIATGMILMAFVGYLARRDQTQGIQRSH